MKKTKYLCTAILVTLLTCACAGNGDTGNTTTGKTDNGTPGISTQGGNMVQTTEEEVRLVAETFQIPEEDFDELRVSLERLHETGCGRVVSLEALREEAGLTYLTIADEDGALYYTDTNKHGNFGAVLTQEGYDNAAFLTEAFNLAPGRSVLYSAQTLQDCHIGKISAVDDVENIRGAYLFTLICADGSRYNVRMSGNGSIGEITDADGNTVFGMPE